jgi:anti-sigma B factor antagonist
MLDFSYAKVGKDKDILAVILTGRLDEETCHYLMDCVAEDVLDGRKKMILDCGGLEYISSLGLGTLVRVNSRMKKLGGDVKLTNVHGIVAQVMSVVGLNKLFQIYPTVDEAVAALGG